MNAKADEALQGHWREERLRRGAHGALWIPARELVEIAKVVMKEPRSWWWTKPPRRFPRRDAVPLRVMKKLRDRGEGGALYLPRPGEIMEVCDTLTVCGTAPYTPLHEGWIDADAIPHQHDRARVVVGTITAVTTPPPSEEIAVKASISSGRPAGCEHHGPQGRDRGHWRLSHCGMHPLGKILFGAVRPDSGQVVRARAKITARPVAMKEKLRLRLQGRDVESSPLGQHSRQHVAIAGMERTPSTTSDALLRERSMWTGRSPDLFHKMRRPGSAGQPALRRGNKQKVVFGKWIGRGSEVLILDCPTRGVDIGVKRAMYQLMTELKNEGKSIVMISEEMPELMGMSDRLIIMKDGKITHEFARSASLSDAEIIQYMI
jgi:ribose transport system ATP-binding protein